MSGAGIAGGQGDHSYAALELLANPTRLQAKLDQLKAAEESAREQIALAGPAGEILNIRAEIDGLKDQAEAHEKHAREECERMIAEAGDAAHQIRQKAENEAAQIVSTAEQSMNAAEEKIAESRSAMAAVESARQDLRVREGKVEDAEAALQQKAEDLAGLEQELKGEKAHLAEVRDAINAVL